MKTWQWLLIAGAAVVVLGGGFKVYQMARGIRNNNPGNIRYNKRITWDGQTGADAGGYVIFESAFKGIRAMARDLITKQGRGLNTIAKIIPVYAPEQDNNDVAAYVASVEKRAVIGRDLPLMAHHMEPLVKAMIHHENGLQPYGDDLIRSAIAAARV